MVKVVLLLNVKIGRAKEVLGATDDDRQPLFDGWSMFKFGTQAFGGTCLQSRGKHNPRQKLYASKRPRRLLSKKNLLNKVKDREHQRAFYCDFSSLVN